MSDPRPSTKPRSSERSFERPLGELPGIGPAWRFVRLTLRKAREDNVPLIGSALAFVTLFSIIPFLALFSFVGSRVFGPFEDRIIDTLAEILPYSEQTILDTIRTFLAQADDLQGFAILALFPVALFAFATVEKTLNRVWNVSDQRPLKARFISFTLILFWGPILIGISFSGPLPALTELFGLVKEPLLVEALSILGSVAALALLYWAVPYTSVRPAAAFAGSLVASFLLTILREGFGYYVQIFRNVNLVYGSFALPLLFMVSIDLAWTIALFGSVVSYTVQHFRVLDRGLQEGFPLEGRWAGLATLSVLSQRFLEGEPIIAHEDLADLLKIPPKDLHRVLQPLLAQDWLRETLDGGKGYVLSIDPHGTTLAQVFAVYDGRCTQVFQPLPAEVERRLRRLVKDLAICGRERLESQTLAQVVSPRRAATNQVSSSTPSVSSAESSPGS